MQELQLWSCFYSQNHLNWSWMNPAKIHLWTFPGLLKRLRSYTSTSIFCTYPTPTFRQKEWPLAQMVPEEQILGGWASTTEKVSPYSYYLHLIIFLWHSYQRQSATIWANTAISTNIHAGKWEANFSFMRRGLCIASTSLLAHTHQKHLTHPIRKQEQHLIAQPRLNTSKNFF